MSLCIADVIMRVPDNCCLCWLALGPGSSIDWEEKAEELQARVWELEKQNANLKGKVHTSNWQNSQLKTVVCLSL